jgi:hypothetical protein
MYNRKIKTNLVPLQRKTETEEGILDYCSFGGF